MGSTVDLGGLGIFLIVAYAVGQAVACVGNFLERLLTCIGLEFPTDDVRSQCLGKKRVVLAAGQLAILPARLQSALGLPSSPEESYGNRSQWRGIKTQVYAYVSAAGRATRVDTFNALYGLNRGIAAAFLSLSALTVFHSGSVSVGERSGYFEVAVLLVLGSVLAAARARRFSKSYERELFTQLLQLSTR
jgi:hypothetical protein